MKYVKRLFTYNHDDSDTERSNRKERKYQKLNKSKFVKDNAQTPK